MTATIAIVNQKGGVGKTTTAVTLAHGLAVANYRVLIVDMDSQGQVAPSLGLTQEPGLYRLLCKGGAGASAITDTGRPGLDAILSDKNTVKVHRHIVTEPLSEYVLKRALEQIAPNYDVMILDTAPGADAMQINAFCACTHFLIPTRLDHLAVQGAAATLATAASLQKLGALQGQFLGVLPTMWEKTTLHTKEQFKILREQFGILMWPPIPDDTKAREATQLGRTLWEHACISPAMSGRATGNGELIGGYRRMVERLIEEIKL